MVDNSNKVNTESVLSKPLNKRSGLLKKWGAIMVLFLALIATFVVFVVFAIQNKNSNLAKIDTKIDVESVRNSFRAGPDAKIIILNSTTTTATSSSVTFTSPRGGSLNSTTTATSSTGIGQDVLPVVYSNSSLGFSIDISNTWQATEANGGHTIIFTNAKGENISVQVYQAPTEGLGLVESQLSGSDSVRNLTKSSFKGESALEFRTTTGLQGVAVIHGNKLYYIMGSVINTEPISSFKFQ